MTKAKLTATIMVADGAGGIAQVHSRVGGRTQGKYFIIVTESARNVSDLQIRTPFLTAKISF